MQIRKQICAILIAALFLVLSQVAIAAPVADPYGYWSYFNVYSLGDIGTSTNYYTSDFQGPAGAAGSAYFRDFELNYSGAFKPFALSVGEDVYLLRGNFHKGGVEAGGDIHLDYFYVQGDVRSGGSVYVGAQNPSDPFDGGAILGSVYSQGGGSMDRFYVSGNVTVNAAGSMILGLTPDGYLNGQIDGTVDLNSSYTFSPLANHSLISAYFLGLSSMMGSLPVTTNYSIDPNGYLVLNVTSGINVINVSEADFLSVWGVQVNGPADAIVYVNVGGSMLTFGDRVWWTTGGAQLYNVVLNFPTATAVTFEGRHAVSMLMPLADVNFLDGCVVGDLVTGNLMGGGQVNEPEILVPEPGTLFLAFSGVAGVAALRRRRARKSA